MHPLRAPTTRSVPQPRSCRVCGRQTVRTVLDLGLVPLANDFIGPGENVTRPVHPLGLQFCGACGIAQITQTVDPEVLFRHYLYTPSASETWRAHCRELSDWIRQRVETHPAPFVVEPASNDGCLLKAILDWTPNVLGVEPARNIAALARSDGVPTMAEFFGRATSGEIRRTHGRAGVVVGTNVLAHVPDIGDFLGGVAGLLADDGLMVIEAPYLGDLIETLAFDTIYHEHVSYLTVTALDHALAAAGLTLTEVERIPIHGGSIRFVGRPAGAERHPSVAGFLDQEARVGLADGSALDDFALRVDRLRERFAATIAELRGRGSRLAAYGATAKGNTLLTTTGVTHDDIDYIVDRNPLKQGRLAPGSLIPVVGPDRLETDPVDVLLLLAWNLKDEIIRDQQAFAARGGRFLVPIPEPVLI